MNQEEIKNAIANNIINYRKSASLTQADIAEKLNYSDKAVSKWERAESLPDVIVLMQLAELFGITLNDLTAPSDTNAPAKRLSSLQKITTHKLFVPFLSLGLVWFAATVIFVFLLMFDALPKPWMAFIYAVPASFIVLTIFNAIWGNKIFSIFIVSCLSWSLLAAIVMTVPNDDAWLLVLLGIPFQVLIILWFTMKIRSAKKNIKPPRL